MLALAGEVFVKAKVLKNNVARTLYGPYHYPASIPPTRPTASKHSSDLASDEATTSWSLVDLAVTRSFSACLQTVMSSRLEDDDESSRRALLLCGQRTVPYGHTMGHSATDGHATEHF